MPDEIDNQDDQTQETEDDSQSQSDKDRNWRRMEEQLQALREENAQLKPLQVKNHISEAGYDPNSDKGKAIRYALQAKGEEAPQTPEAIQEFVVSEFNWKPSKSLTPEESQTQDSQSRIDRLRQESESEEPPDAATRIQDAEQSAETDEDWMNVGLAKLTRTMQQASE